MIGEHESKPSEARPTNDENDLDQLMNDLNNKSPIEQPFSFEARATYQWILMVEMEIEEVRAALEKLFPEASKDGGDSDPILRLIRRAEKSSNRRVAHSETSDSFLALMVERMKTFFVDEANGRLQD